jgi:hypothetical protein
MSTANVFKKAEKEPQLPKPYKTPEYFHDIKSEGWGLILADLQIPFHDLRTVTLAVNCAVQRDAKWVLLNGDILDSAELSDFDKTPDDPKWKEETILGKQFLEYLRFKLPHARIIWKNGNHEERLGRYVAKRAPAIWHSVNIQSELDFAKYGVELAPDRCVIVSGKLHIIHGHEYGKAFRSQVNPARGLYLRAKASALCAHFHRTSEHHEKTISRKFQGAWSIGCACLLNPHFSPMNDWNNGFAMQEVHRGGHFSLENKTVIDGVVV